jgi:uncharacterized protein YxjI
MSDSSLQDLKSFTLQQRFEPMEFLGFETRNKYEIQSSSGASLGFAAEQAKGIGAIMARQIFGHWRTFEIRVFDAARQPWLVARHPFRWLFNRIEVFDAAARHVGSIQQRWGWLNKRFDFLGARDEILMTVRSPLWSPWTFRVLRRGKVVAEIKKRWTGLLAEAVTDKDRFTVDVQDATLNLDERRLLLAAALFVDLVYFETKR